MQTLTLAWFVGIALFYYPILQIGWKDLSVEHFNLVALGTFLVAIILWPITVVCGLLALLCLIPLRLSGYLDEKEHIQ